MSEAIDLRRNVELCLEALEAIVPLADAAGIETGYDDAYDEWEEIVEALYLSFVVSPVCDGSPDQDIRQFHRPGFETGGEARAAVLVDVDARAYFIFDIAKGDGNRMRLVLRPVDGVGEGVLACAEDCVNFRVGVLGKG
ncbi:hypothetical protein [Roseovarius sp.]|uniref:hypothetical protein n=1 Tax=Roseovarius sp. TaxID=1486281 RepID=UPI00262C709F|nr:hypothetical protein [Roseovarius sp.]MDM8165840.1 hypothetical protein [Roseovarius sp.]